MKRITTTEEFNDSGKLIKRTVVEETDVQGGRAVYIPLPNPPMPSVPPRNWGDVIYHTEITCEK